MEARFLVAAMVFQCIRGAWFALLVAVATANALVYSQLVNAADKKVKPFIADPVSAKQTVRFYKANKQLQADRVIITADKASNPGCNNFLKKVRIFKALQIGFYSCSLYAAKDCNIGSLVPVNAEKQERQTYLLTEGSAWFAQGDDSRGADVRSWYCGMQLEQGELRAETELASREASRLNKARLQAKLKLEKSQAAFSEAKKNLQEARGYKQRAVQEAIAVGAIEVVEEPEVEANVDNQGSEKVIED